MFVMQSVIHSGKCSKSVCDVVCKSQGKCSKSVYDICSS